MAWRVLVTGAAGFIGFHTAKKLSHIGHYVVGMDNFCPYYDVQLKNGRADELKRLGMNIISAGVENTEQLNRIIEEERITHVVHLAAQAGVRYSLLDPSSYIRSNIDGFLSVLEALRAHPAIGAVWASSSSVYGTNTKIPFSEEDKTDSPTNLYGATKKANEVMAHAYHHLFGLKLIGLRFFTVYGPWGRPDMAYFLFADKMMRNEPIDVFGNGALRRDFTYIDDIVDGIIKALAFPKPYAVYNLGNSHAESVLYLISCLEASLGRKASIHLVDQQPGDMVDTWADTRLAYTDLGFEPKIGLKEGVARFATWFLEYAVTQNITSWRFGC